MDVNALGGFIQTLGFPIACVCGQGLFCWKFVSRIQDENKVREEKLMQMLESYGAKMQAISAALERLSGEIDNLKG